MKFSTSILVAALPLVASVSAVPAGFGGNKGGFGGGKGGNANKGGNGGGNANKGGQNNNGGGAAAASASAAAASAAAASAAAASSSASAGNGGNANNSTGSGGNGGGGDIQSSLTLDPSVIATGFEQNGQASQEAGQVASLTSNNNFINFCAGQTITNGLQIKTGSCNPAPMGQIAAQTNMPASKFSNPKNGDTIPANQAFTITMNINNLVTGNFVNAATNYYSAPQQIDKGSGNIIGHTHFTVESLSALDQTTPTNNVNFAFFKGVNTAAQGGAVSEDVTAGLPAGFYKLSSINSAANHQPALVAVAQHGSLDDAVYFTVSDGGAASASNSSASAGSAASNSTAAAAAASTSTAAAASGGNANAGKGGNGNANKGGAANNGAGKGAAAGKGGAAKGGKGRRFLQAY